MDKHNNRQRHGVMYLKHSTVWKVACDVDVVETRVSPTAIEPRLIILFIVGIIAPCNSRHTSATVDSQAWREVHCIWLQGRVCMSVALYLQVS